MNINGERARGALMGLAVGDALGTALEFQAREAPPFPLLAEGPLREIVGGGPFGVAPGQVTDDTQMASCLATSLKERGRFDVGDVAARYVAWSNHAFDIGLQTAAALTAIARGTTPKDSGRVVWESRGRNAAGNGSLMRTAPIGVFFAKDRGALRRAAREDSAITHYDPRCQEACVAFNAAIATAVSTDQGTEPDILWQAARSEITREDLANDLDAARADDPQLYSLDLHLHHHQGFVRVAFRLAFWELLHARTFEDALLDVVNRGGDADTNGAITGALLGSMYGENRIPLRWREAVLNALQDSPPGPLRDLYHPRRLLDLVE
jgi:ADP-ribosyl-[dinitrogen reductase] hydrolase